MCIRDSFTIPVGKLEEEIFEDGLGFDGSSIRGWQAINESDMLLVPQAETCLLYTSDAADERSSVDLGGRRIIKKKKKTITKKNTKQKKKTTMETRTQNPERLTRMMEE